MIHGEQRAESFTLKIVYRDRAGGLVALTLASKVRPPIAISDSNRRGP